MQPRLTIHLILACLVLVFFRSEAARAVSITNGSMSEGQETVTGWSEPKQDESPLAS